jgi:preprotein translocase subunit SecD
MYKNLRWKFLVTALVAVIAIWAFVPPKQKIKLGLDLQGGLELIYRVETDAALKIETDTTSEQIGEALKSGGITVGGIKVRDLTSFEVNGVPSANDSQFRTLADQTAGGSFSRDAGDTAGSYIFNMKPNVVVTGGRRPSRRPSRRSNAASTNSACQSRWSRLRQQGRSNHHPITWPQGHEPGQAGDPEHGTAGDQARGR